jgi:hypothetical protein
VRATASFAQVRFLVQRLRVVRPGGRIVVADAHFVNWPTPAAFNRGVTSVATHRPALSLTVALR